MIKLAFFDIDGTLVSFKTHRVPDSALEALRQARENGVRLFISTGRPRQFLSALTYLEPYFDGYITCNGAFCFMGDNVLSKQSLPRLQVDKILHECMLLGRTCVVVGENKVSIVNPSNDLHDIFTNLLNIDVNMASSPLEEVLAGEIFQVIPFLTVSEEEPLLIHIPDCTALRWHPAFVDISRRGTDKGSAIRCVAEAMGIDIADTIAFGDGGNDIPMLQAAGIGVAMGNARDEVKEHADYVTTSVDDDGIANAFCHFSKLFRE